jgi:hypothetical protein
MARHELVRGVEIAMLFPGFGEHELFVRVEKGIFAYLAQIMRKTAFPMKNR